MVDGGGVWLLDHVSSTEQCESKPCVYVTAVSRVNVPCWNVYSVSAAEQRIGRQRGAPFSSVARLGSGGRETSLCWLTVVTAVLL